MNRFLQPICTVAWRVGTTTLFNSVPRPQRLFYNSSTVVVKIIDKESILNKIFRPSKKISISGHCLFNKNLLSDYVVEDWLS
jgi:hypothetical protein